MDHEVSHTYSAPAEVVFSTAMDPDRMYRWLPDDLTIEPTGDDLVRVRRGRSADHYQVSVDLDTLTVIWHPRDTSGWRGQFQVEENHAGASIAHLRLSALDQSEADPSGEMTEALRRLELEVAENFTAG